MNAEKNFSEKKNSKRTKLQKLVDLYGKIDEKIKLFTEKKQKVRVEIEGSISNFKNPDEHQTITARDFVLNISEQGMAPVINEDLVYNSFPLKTIRKISKISITELRKETGKSFENFVESEIPATRRFTSVRILNESICSDL